MAAAARGACHRVLAKPDRGIGNAGANQAKCRGALTPGQPNQQMGNYPADLKPRERAAAEYAEALGQHGGLGVFVPRRAWLRM